MAKVVEANFDFVSHIVIGSAGDEDAAGFGERFETGGDVDTIAVEIAALDHNVTQIDADAQHNVAVVAQIAVGGSHVVLQLDRALHSIDCTAKLDEDTVAGKLEDTPLMLGDQRLQYLLPPGLEPDQCASLILLHEAAVTDHIDSQDGGKAT